MFGVDRKQVRTWLKNEEIIQQQKHSSKASGRGCTGKYPIMEGALYAEYKEARAKGKFLKRWWFNTRAKQLLKDHYLVKSSSVQANGLSDSANDMELLCEEKHMLRKLIQNNWHQQ